MPAGGWRPADDPLVGLTDDARVADAIAERSRQRRLREQAVEAATLVGALRDLAERGAAVIVTTRDGRAHSGALVAVAVDHVALTTPAGARALIRRGALATVRPDPTAPPRVPQGERDAALDRLLLEQCARWAEDRPQVAVAVSGAADVLRGTLTAVGEDLLTVVPDGSRQPTYVAGDAIEAIVRTAG